MMMGGGFSSDLSGSSCQADQVPIGIDRNFAHRQTWQRRMEARRSCRDPQQDAVAIDDENLTVSAGRRHQSETAPIQGMGWIDDCYLIGSTIWQSNRCIKMCARMILPTSMIGCCSG